jgi:hypothetical protein
MRRIAALLALALLLTACGDDGGGGEAGDTTDEVRTTPVTFGEGDEVWLRVDTGGGLVPVIINQREAPEVLLFDDGRLVRLTSDDGAVVPAFEAAQLDESEVAAILDEAGAVIDGPDVGFPNVTDLPTTTIRLTTDGDKGTLDVYALGFDDDQLTSDEQSARAAVTALLDDLATAGDAEPFVPEEWLVLTTASLEGADVTEAVPWPLDPDRAATIETPSVCTRVTGEEAEAVFDALASDDPFTYVDTGTTVVEVALRPVLTGEETCNLSENEDFVER